MSRFADVHESFPLLCGVYPLYPQILRLKPLHNLVHYGDQVKNCYNNCYTMNVMIHSTYKNDNVAIET